MLFCSVKSGAVEGGEGEGMSFVVAETEVGEFPVLASSEGFSGSGTMSFHARMLR